MAADVRVELQEPVAGSKVIYSKSAVNGRGLSIGLDSSRTLDIEFFVNEEGGIEVSASVSHVNGEYQDIAVIRRHEDGRRIEVLVSPGDEEKEKEFYVPLDNELLA